MLSGTRMKTTAALLFAGLIIFTFAACREQINDLAGPAEPEPTPAPTLPPLQGDVPPPPATPTPTPGPTPPPGEPAAQTLTGAWVGRATDTSAFGCDAFSERLRFFITQETSTLQIVIVTSHPSLVPADDRTEVTASYDSNLRTFVVHTAIQHDLELETKIDIEGVWTQSDTITGTYSTETCNIRTGICFCRRSGDINLSRE